MLVKIIVLPGLPRELRPDLQVRGPGEAVVEEVVAAVGMVVEAAVEAVIAAAEAGEVTAAADTAEVESYSKCGM